MGRKKTKAADIKRRLREDDEIISRFMKKHPGEAEEIEVSLEYGEKLEHGMIVLPDNSKGRGPMYAALMRKL